MPAVDGPWAALSAIGGVLAVVGLVDLVLVWYPLAFQNPEWEFGTVTAALDGLPVTAMGLGLLLAGAVHSQSHRAIRVLCLVFGLLGVAVLAAGVLYATVIPMALRVVADPALAVGLHRAIIKTVVQAVAYPIVFLYIAFRSWR